MNMNSVFSNYEAISANCTQETKPSKIYNQLRIAYNQGAKGILDCTRMFQPYSEQDEDYITYEIWSNPELAKIVQWVNKKITLELGKLDYRAINVRLRIATGMLNKLDLPKKLHMDIHFYLSHNVGRELSLINTEDLPF
jgi:hypothetical protein